MTLIVGCGNLDRGDDAAGVLAARGFVSSDKIAVLEAGLDISAILDHWAQYERVVLIDAVLTGAAPGTIHRWGREGIPAQPHKASSHGFSLSDLIRMADVLYGSEMEVLVIGIEAESFGFQAALSPAVQEAVEGLTGAGARATIRA